MNDLAVKQQSIAEFLNSPAVQQNIESVLGSRKDQFITSITSLVNSNESLQVADRRSLFNACLTAASLDLPINQNLGFAYIIPYKQKDGTQVAQFQMGYKGFIQLSMRSGQFRTINVTDVREGEIVSNDRLTGEIRFNWIQEERETTKIVGYVAYMELINGFTKSLYMTQKELNAHGVRYSKSMKKGYGLWKDDFDAMAKKTVIKLLLSKYAPMNTQMQRAQLADQAVIGDDDYHYVDNKPIDATEVGTEKERARVLKHIKEAKSLDELEKVVDHLDGDELLKAYNTKLDSFLDGSQEPLAEKD
jgi:recombination protein RecT